MQYQAIAIDYDGTLATSSHVDEATVFALKEYREAGGQLVMVTGRKITDLHRVFPALEVFNGIVGENGAVFYRPETKHVKLLGKPLPREFVVALKAQGVKPVEHCQVIVATCQPHETTVQATINKMGLEAEVMMNQQAVMVLPKGVSKASGLKAAIAELGIAIEQVAGIGDAENDLDFLKCCGLAIAVENALPQLKAIAHRVTTQPRGAGVQEAINWILSPELIVCQTRDRENSKRAEEE